MHKKKVQNVNSENRKTIWAAFGYSSNGTSAITKLLQEI
jgi:hypothetical protein